MRKVAIRYSGGVIKIAVMQESTMDGEIPKIDACLMEKVTELSRAEARIRELEAIVESYIG